ncbi:hypothetical protein GQR99_06580 [Cereibacter sphaeroides]|nr:hypothetical protein GQR99_06580 [Cereibacter sphaeroides]QHA13215.1 hypothetical protein GQY06_06565 [Cereibacter sphaeroides]
MTSSVSRPPPGQMPEPPPGPGPDVTPGPLPVPGESPDLPPTEPDLPGGPASRRPFPFNRSSRQPTKELPVNSIIYIVGLVVIVIAILSFLGLR